VSYKKLEPAEILKPYVESIWIQEYLSFSRSFLPTRIIPSTKIDLLFYYLDPFVQHRNNSTEKIPLNVVHGQMTKPVEVSATGKTGIIIFSFYPWGLAPFVDNPTYEFTDNTIDSGFIFDFKVINELRSKILESKNNYERVNHIQKFLINRICEKSVDKFVIYLSKIINESYAKIRLNKVAKNYNISRRHLQRRFSTATGLSPKQFAEIIRFQKALYLKRSGYHWNEIAENCGYYDQSHFIKEVKSYAGISPEKIYKEIIPTKLMKFFNAPVSMSHFYNTVYL
jgi:AraC-like DNA-binding protein